MSKTFSALLALLSLAPLAGCAAQPASDEDSASTTSAIDGAARVQFDASWHTTVTGTLRVGSKVTVAYDPARLTTCRGEEGGRPQWSISLVWRLGTATGTTSIAGLMAPAANEVTLDLPATGDLEIWFQNTSKYGCVAWDSNYGANYHFTVAAAANAPGWMGNAASVVARETCFDGKACDSSRRALESGFTFDTWARQRATITGAYFDVWKAGVTDFDNPDLWKQLDARVYYRAVGVSAWSWAYVPFEKRVGNDARYGASLRAIDPLGGRTRTSKSDCPAGTLTLSADGQYVQQDVELYFVVNGTELRPAKGGVYRGTFIDYKGLYAPCL